MPRGKPKERYPTKIRTFMGGLFLRAKDHFEIHCKDCMYSVNERFDNAEREVLRFKAHRKLKHPLVIES